MEDWPRGDFARAASVRRAAGGKGINVSRVLAELKIPSTALCLTGGPDAHVFEALLEEAPFEVKSLRIAAPTRTNVTLTARRQGRLSKVNQPGPTVTRREWAALESQIRALMAGRQWVVLSGALPPGLPTGTYGRLVRQAHQAGARVALDCTGESLLKALGQKPDLVKPNREELAATLGHPCRSRRAALEGIGALQALGAQMVVLSHGAAECLAASPAEAWAATPPPISPGGSPMGAGDSLLAGLVAGLIQGHPLPEALRLGMACGAACAAAPDTVLARLSQVRSLKSKIRPLRLA